MIITETYYVNNILFTRTYSDANRYVVRDGISYTEACDPAEFNRTYTEGDTIVNEEEERIEGDIVPEPYISYEEALDIILGEEE